MRKNTKYNTDGLIFTPMSYKIKQLDISKEPDLTKNRWYASYKWKEPKDNTIDFLIKIKNKSELNIQHQQDFIREINTIELYVGKYYIDYRHIKVVYKHRHVVTYNYIKICNVCI